MIVTLDPERGTAPYEQIRAQIEGFIRAGTLKPGAQLPSVRQLAGDLGVAPGTVARAYRELEEAGLVVANGRRGTQVSSEPPALAANEQRQRVRRAASEYIAIGKQLGLSRADLIAALRDA